MSSIAPRPLDLGPSNVHTMTFPGSSCEKKKKIYQNSKWPPFFGLIRGKLGGKTPIVYAFLHKPVILLPSDRLSRPLKSKNNKIEGSLCENLKVLDLMV